MAENARKLSPEEIEINRILAETKVAVTKTESDIKKLSELGSPELQYNPPGMSGGNPQQLKKDIDSLKDNIQYFKNNAMAQIDKVIENIPDNEKDNFKKIATKELFPDRLMKENNKLVENVSFGDRFTQSLGFSKFLEKDTDLQEKAASKNLKPSKETGEKEKD